VGNNIFVVVALRHLSLTLFYILVFTSPMVIAVLGRLFLGERIDLRKGAAILAGFAGVVIAINPFQSGVRGSWIGYGACAVCVSCFSVAIVWSRVISRSERAESAVFFSGLAAAGVGSLGMLIRAVPLTARLFGLLALMGLLCALGSICTFLAVKLADSATVAQFHYTQLVSGALVAYLLFHEVPTVSMLVGATVIIAAGLYIAMVVTGEDKAPKAPASTSLLA
jgi:drug/metabolite transporter (DMT)-like permease